MSVKDLEELKLKLKLKIAHHRQQMEKAEGVHGHLTAYTHEIRVHILEDVLLMINQK